MTDFKKNKDLVFEQVAQATQQANRSKESVNIIAVTKYVDSGVAARLIDTGIEHIGENRVDMFLDKYEALKDRKLTWHLIGSLQRRKVKNVINFVDYSMLWILSNLLQRFRNEQSILSNVSYRLIFQRKRANTVLSFGN